MKIRTKSTRIMKSMARVLARIPPKLRRNLEDYVQEVSAIRDYGIPDPFFEQPPARFSPRTYTAELEEMVSPHIVFVLPVCRRLSDQALVAVAARQLGRAATVMRLNPDGRTRIVCEEIVCTDGANELALRWGFAKEIRAFEREWPAVRAVLLKMKKDGTLDRAFARRCAAMHTRARSGHENKKARTRRATIA
jgi:hypothetical protein